MCASEEEGLEHNKDAIKYNKCTACRKVYYCPRSCQTKHWLVHKPDCFTAQGKPVPDSIRDKAARILAEWEEAKHQQEEQARNEYAREVQAAVTAFFNKSPSEVKTMSEDCCGKRRRAHLPMHGLHCEGMVAISLGLVVETELS